MYKYNINNQVHNKQVYIRTVQNQQVSRNQTIQPTRLKHKHMQTHTRFKPKETKRIFFIQWIFIYTHKKHNKVFIYFYNKQINFNFGGLEYFFSQKKITSSLILTPLK